MRFLDDIKYVWNTRISLQRFVFFIAGFVAALVLLALAQAIGL